MLSPKQLLINSVTLLCLEHREGVATSPSTELVGQVLESLPLPEGTIDHDHGRQTFLELRQFLTWLNQRNKDNFPTEVEVLQQVQIACREEAYLHEALQAVLLAPVSDPKSQIKQIHSYRGNMQEYLNEEKIMSILKEYHHGMAFKRQGIADVREHMLEMGEKLAPYINARGKQKHPACMGSMDFSDEESVEKYFTEAKNLLSTDGAFRTGWKGMNRALGKVGAIKRGEFVTVAGLQHNFKSGFMLSLFVFFCLFSKPYLRDSTRKPLLLFITFENEIPDNLLWIYKYIKENETGEPVIDSEINIKEVTAYVSARLRETGFEVKMERFDPTEFSAAGFTAFLEGLVADGYELQAIIVDYLNMLSKVGLESKVAGDDIRLLFRRVRNWTAPRGITFITPHQMSADALEKTRENVEDLVKVVANKGYYDGCRRLGQEPDLEFFIHIVEVNGKKYLTVQRGKHRNTVTPVKDQYFVLPFKPVGTLPWDIDKEEEYTLATPGGGAIGSEEETPWWA